MPDIAGLKLIVPTSVAGSGVSVSATGKVTFTAAGTININGCFTSSYDNYLIVARHSASTDAAAFLRLRASGTDASGTDYTRQYLEASGTSVSGARATSQTSASMMQVSSNLRSGTHIYLYGPNLAQPTAMRNVEASGLANAYIIDYVATHSLSTAYDGFTLFMSSGNMTGALCIFGLSQ